MQTLYKWSIDEGVYVDIIHVECDDIMLNHHLQLDVAFDFTYVTNGILVVHVGCKLFLVVNYNCKLRLFFLWKKKRNEAFMEALFAKVGTPLYEGCSTSMLSTMLLCWIWT